MTIVKVPKDYLIISTSDSMIFGSSVVVMPSMSLFTP